MYMITDTPHVRELEAEKKMSLVGQELKFGKWLAGGWSGYASRPLHTPGVTVPVWLELEEGDVIEVSPKPLEQVMAIAETRAK